MEGVLACPHGANLAEKDLKVWTQVNLELETSEGPSSALNAGEVTPAYHSDIQVELW
jgi:hypothetical protein